ncbi:MAG: hypothetical protein ABWY20_10155 [Mycobacterium sp.]
MAAPVVLGGRYELRGVLGRGGWAEVHDGWDTRLGRAVAIKLLYAGFSADPSNRRRFEAEAAPLRRSITPTSLLCMTTASTTARRSS